VDVAAVLGGAAASAGDGWFPVFAGAPAVVVPVLVGAGVVEAAAAGFRTGFGEGKMAW
jgi:hypothetical protein